MRRWTGQPSLAGGLIEAWYDQRTRTVHGAPAWSVNRKERMSLSAHVPRPVTLVACWRQLTTFATISADIFASRYDAVANAAPYFNYGIRSDDTDATKVGLGWNNDGVNFRVGALSATGRLQAGRLYAAVATFAASEQRLRLWENGVLTDNVNSTSNLGNPVYSAMAGWTTSSQFEAAAVVTFCGMWCRELTAVEMYRLVLQQSLLRPGRRRSLNAVPVAASPGFFAQGRTRFHAPTVR
jgi:hypothetical protein